jgi:hypothetical protein
MVPCLVGEGRRADHGPDQVHGGRGAHEQRAHVRAAPDQAAGHLGRLDDAEQPAVRGDHPDPAACTVRTFDSDPSGATSYALRYRRSLMYTMLSSGENARPFGTQQPEVLVAIDELVQSVGGLSEREHR